MRDEERIGSYYDSLVEQFGHDPRAVDAGSAEALTIRYRVLGDVASLDDKDVLEIGCGYGGLGAELRRRYPRIRYRGIDVSPRMIELGSRANPALDLRVGALSELGPADAADVVLAQGIFYLLSGNAEAKMAQMIDEMWALAREAVAFTTMSEWGGSAPSGEFFVAPERLLSLCSPLTGRLALRHDYHDSDVAMYLYRAA